MTELELLDAIREIIADDKVVDALLDCRGLPETLRYTAEKAFMDELTGSAPDTVRAGLKMLKDPGWFTFSKEKLRLMHLLGGSKGP